MVGTQWILDPNCLAETRLGKPSGQLALKYWGLNVLDVQYLQCLSWCGLVSGRILGCIAKAGVLSPHSFSEHNFTLLIPWWVLGQGSNPTALGQAPSFPCPCVRSSACMAVGWVSSLWC